MGATPGGCEAVCPSPSRPFPPSPALRLFAAAAAHAAPPAASDAPPCGAALPA